MLRVANFLDVLHVSTGNGKTAIAKVPFCRVAVAPGIFLDCVETSHGMITRQRPAGRDLHHHAAAQLESVDVGSPIKNPAVVVDVRWTAPLSALAI